MIPVAQYIDTMGTEKFKEFLLSPFDLDFLLEKSHDQKFAGWKGKSMGNWWKFTFDSVVLEFFPTHYDVKKATGTTRLPLPKTLNDFITDMHRLNIELFWSEWVEENFYPKDFLAKDKIETYYVNLLAEMDKSHELLTKTSQDGND